MKRIQMQEPMRTLFLSGLKETGNLEDAALRHEEDLTSRESHQLQDFAKWLKAHDLSVGHGTIDIRWTEFQYNAKPISREEAYQVAMKEAGL